MSGTATVELLTAEVRVLMVGSRQVTLSVARQLDYVSLDVIEPFGRVRIGDDERIIGSSRDDGTLVLARFERHPHRRPYLNEEDLDPERDDKPVICDRVMARDHEFGVALGGRSFDMSARAMDRCGKHPYGKGQCEHWNPNGHEKHIRAAIERWDADCAKHDRAAELPLIVLAGLK